MPHVERTSMELSRGSRTVILGVFLLGICLGCSPRILLAQTEKSGTDLFETQTSAVTQISDELIPPDSFGSSSIPDDSVLQPWSKVDSVVNERSPVPTSAPLAKPGEPDSGSNRWAFQFTPYLWTAGFNGTVTIRNLTAPVSASFSDLFKRLNFGFLGSFDARKGRVGILLDTVYLNLSADNTIGQTNLQSKSDNKLFFLDPEVYFRVVKHRRGSIDALAGFRYWHSGNSLTISPPAVSASRDKDFVDPVLGGRFRLNLSRGLFATFKGDVGGFGAGSQLTYQIFAGGGVELKQKFVLIAGYRHLYVDLGNSGLLQNYAINGLALGFGIKFGQR